MKRKITFISLLMIGIVGCFGILHAMNEGEVSADSDVKVDEKAENERKEFMEEAKKNPSPEKEKENEEIYTAHTLVNSITYNTTFDNDGKAFNDDDVKSTLMKINGNLKMAKHLDETKINEAIDLVGSIRDASVSKDHPSLEELHDIIHDLDEKINKDMALVDVDVKETGEPYNEEDYYKE